MKLHNILTEEVSRSARGGHDNLIINTKNFNKNQPEDYWFEYAFSYEVNGGEFKREVIEAHKRADYKNFDALCSEISRDFKIPADNKQKITKNKNTVWLAYELGKIESHVGEDIDGEYEYLTGDGNAWIVSTTELSSQMLKDFASRLEARLDKEAAEEIEDAHAARKDAESKAKDPYKHYGLNRADFY